MNQLLPFIASLGGAVGRGGLGMKFTGMVRKIDELGRIVLPSELRRVMAIHEGDELDISVDQDCIILQKRQDLCVFCRAADAKIEYQDRRVCERCAGELGQMGRIELKLPDDEVVTS